VKPEKRRHPTLRNLYARYLQDEDTAKFIRSVAERYTTATLERLAEHGPRESRRAATLALGFLGDFSSNMVLGRRLSDHDRVVRMIAENAIREVWCRDGSESQRMAIRIVMRLNQIGQWTSALSHASRLIKEAPGFAEAWNQRAVAHFHLGRVLEAIHDGRQALEINPYHFTAAMGMAHGYLQLDDRYGALECFQRALKLNPGLERVRVQVARLRRSLKGK
jgi:tetratricopeptide (TPR) repeat protein